MTYHHLLWIVNLDTAGVFHCVILLCSAKGRFWCLLSKMSLMLQSLTWRMLVHLIIWKRKKWKAKNPEPLLSPPVFFPFMHQISAETSICLCWWWLKHHIPRSDDQSGPPSLCHYCWPVAHFYPPVISWPPWEEAAGSREGEGAECVGNRDRKAGKTRVESGWRGERAATSSGRTQGREKIEPSRWIAGWKVKED